MGETYRLLLNPDFVDRIDSLYLFAGDVSDEASGSITFAIKENVAARLALLGGRVYGDGMAAGTIPNDARYWVSSARVDVLPERHLGLRPLPPPRAGAGGRCGGLPQQPRVGRRDPRPGDPDPASCAPSAPAGRRSSRSRWGAGRRALADPRPNRQMAGGLSLSF